MTTLAMRMIKGDFVVTGPDVEADEVSSPAARPRTGAPSIIRDTPIEEIGPRR